MHLRTIRECLPSCKTTATKHVVRDTTGFILDTNGAVNTLVHVTCAYEWCCECVVRLLLLTEVVCVEYDRGANECILNVPRLIRAGNGVMHEPHHSFSSQRVLVLCDCC